MMVGMTLLFFMFGLPVFCAVAWVVLLVKGPRTGLLIGLIMCAVTFAAGYWSILQSRASTAGIGFLFLPGAGALSGLLAALFARLRTHPKPANRTAAWLCLAGSLGVGTSFGIGGLQERAKNRGRDREQVEHRRSFDEDRLRIAEMMQKNPGTESTALDAEIERHIGDQSFLTAAVETAYVSEDRLDQLSTRDGLVLSVARNPRTRSDTLERIYRKSAGATHGYQMLPEFQALAAHKNTPLDILRAIANGPESNPLIDRALAGNPSAPRDVLDKIAGSGDVYMLRSLLGNAALDCGLLRKAAARLGPGDRNEVRSTDAAIASLEARLCVAR
jgi:hypothetical protein